MRFLLPLLAALVLASPIGCTPARLSRGSSALLDSLRSENATLRARVRRLRDSLRFRQDLRTGQYYRNLRTLKDRLNRLLYEVQMLRGGGQTVDLLLADSLFAPGTTTLTPAGKKQLRPVIRRLETTYPHRTIRVEGHTDNVPLGEAFQERFASNWELSCARATAVVRYLIDRSTLDPTQFVAVGYGATEPVASNETARGRRRNRRVRIAVLPSPRHHSRPFETAW